MNESIRKLVALDRVFKRNLPGISGNALNLHMTISTTIPAFAGATCRQV